MPMKGWQRLASHQAYTAKLFVDDRREVVALSTSEMKCVSDVIRELVHESLRARWFRAFGCDEGGEFIHNLHREAIAEGLNPMIAELGVLRQTVESFPARMSKEMQPVTAKAMRDDPLRFSEQFRYEFTNGQGRSRGFSEHDIHQRGSARAYQAMSNLPPILAQEERAEKRREIAANE